MAATVRCGRCSAFTQWIALALAVASSGCSSPPPPTGTVLLVVDTNLTPGRDFDAIRVRVTVPRSGFVREFAFEYAWNESAGLTFLDDKAKLPLSIDLTNAEPTLEERVASVTAWKAKVPVFERSARLVLPYSGVRELRIPVESSCVSPRADGARWAVSQPETGWAKSCGATETCVAGQCVSDHVDANALPKHAGEGSTTACVSLEACFGPNATGNAPAQRVRLRPAGAGQACSADVTAFPERASFTVAVVERDGRGICSGGTCLSLLDRVESATAQVGWVPAPGRIILPRALCTDRREVWIKPTAGSACVEKSPSTPPCAEWVRGPTTPARAPDWSAPLRVEGGGDAPFVCATVTPSATLCRRDDVSVGCGEVLVTDPACEGRARYAQCGPCTGDTRGMTFVRGGSFTMGSDGNASAPPNEQPAHRVDVADFWLDTWEVGKHDVFAWCRSAPEATVHCKRLEDLLATCAACSSPADHPSGYTSWSAANAYCRSRGLRLPTEEEWEYAARNGGQTIEYPWGNEAPDHTRLCWSRGDTFRLEPCERGAFPAGATTLGIHDLGGNMSEWTSSGSSGSYTDARTTSARVVRGAIWGFDDASFARTRARQLEPADMERASLGFRCAR
jgi:hypothetical protein